MKNEIILIKIGGSSITDKKVPYKLKTANLDKLSKEISKFKNFSIILCHGSGSFGHASASKYGGSKGYKSKMGIAIVCNDAAKINEIVTNSLISAGVPAISIRPRGIIYTKSGKMIANHFQILEEIVSQKMVPVICGDVIWDTDWKTTIYSGEKSLNLIARYLIKKGYRVNKIIEVGETSGLLDSEGNTIHVVNNKNWNKLSSFLFKTKKMDVTGGMKHKIEEALELTEFGVETILIDVGLNDQLKNAILGRKVAGTRITA